MDTTQPVKSVNEKKPSISPIIKFWIISICFALLFFNIFFFYIFLMDPTLSLLSLSKAVAATAAVMIGLSFAFSGLSFYFESFTPKLAYRKYFGLLGYFFALTYSLLLLVVSPERYLMGLPTYIFSADVILGLSAMTILTTMALISNKWAMIKLGRTWRRILHLGYLAYLLLIIRAVIIEGDSWMSWLRSINTLPPPRLLITMFALGVILFRLSISIVPLLKNKTQ